MKDEQQVDLRPGQRVTWDRQEITEGWERFLDYAGDGPFRIISIGLPPCTCGMSDDCDRVHAPGCLQAMSLDLYLTLSRPDGSPLMDPSRKRLISISAQFLKVVE